MDRDLQVYYAKLLEAINRPVFRNGQWSLCERTGWPDNTTFQNLVAWNWRLDDERYLVVVNLSDWPVQARVQLPWADVGWGRWQLIDKPSGATYERDGAELLSAGLYAELGPGTATSSSAFARARRRDDPRVILSNHGAAGMRVIWVDSTE